MISPQVQEEKKVSVPLQGLLWVFGYLQGTEVAGPPYH